MAGQKDSWFWSFWVDCCRFCLFCGAGCPGAARSERPRAHKFADSYPHSFRTRNHHSIPLALAADLQDLGRDKGLAIAGFTYLLPEPELSEPVHVAASAVVSHAEKSLGLGNGLLSLAGQARDAGPGPSRRAARAPGLGTRGLGWPRSIPYTESREPSEKRCRPAGSENMPA